MIVQLVCRPLLRLVATAGIALVFTVSVAADIMTFDSDSDYVGIGTAIPADRVHIKGGNLRVQNNNATGKNGYIQLGTASSSAMAPMVSGRSEDLSSGMSFRVQPDSSSQTMFGHSAFIFTGMSGTGGVLQGGDLLQLRRSTSWTSFAVDHEGQVKIGATWREGGFNLIRINDESGAYLSSAGVWTNSSTRKAKRDIVAVDTAAAWALLDALAPVDYEYRRQERRWRLGDGREVASIDDLSEAEREALAPVPFVVWTDEGSGEHHRGFIAEDLPDVLRSGDDAVAAIDIAAHNTAALKHAKTLILSLQKSGATLEQEAEALLAQVAMLESDTARQVSTVSTTLNALDTRMAGVETVVADLQGRLDDTYVEISMEEAFEWVPETTPVVSVQSVVRYRVDWDSPQVLPYETVEEVIEKVPTGRSVRRLKDGVVFDDRTGAFYLAPVSQMELSSFPQ